jgi:RND family efflux transporter MFP subunit
MSKTKIIGIALFVTALIIGVLLYNKSRMDARSKSDVLTTVPVSVAGVTKQRISDAHSLTGTVAANNDVAIISETAGRVVAVAADIGQFKPAGALLIQVDDELKRANLAMAETNFEKAKRDLERFESLSKENAATDQQVEATRLAMKSAEAQFVAIRREFNDTKITTPISGIVTSRPVDIGTYVQKGMPVANVVDISRLKVKLNVAERDVFRLAVGDAVSVTSDVYPGIRFAGRVKTISAKGDESHTYPVEIVLENNASHPLRAGMFARVAFTTLSRDEVLTIPREALVGSLKNPQVYVVQSGMARLRQLVIDSESGTELEVLQGLGVGDTVVVNGQNNLKDNVPVTIAR